MQRSFNLIFFACVLVAGLMLLASQTSEAQDSTEAESRLFAVEIKTGPNWDASRAAYDQPYFKEHSENLKRLRGEGRIVMGARYSDIGLIIISAVSVEEVEAMMDQDASMTAGTFVFEVHAFNMFYSYADNT